MLARNKATVKEVIRAVFVQHVLQTLLGLVWLEDEATVLKREFYRDHLGDMTGLAPKVATSVLVLLGKRTGGKILEDHGEALVRWVYWWGIPSAQIFLGFVVIDTYQYFMHRLFHTYHFLYRHIHSVHHRLYCPYAFGALYNHPLEGVLFDTLSAAIAHSLLGLSARQDILLFTFSTLKTVDDHSGYRLWWDPLQMIFANNADYHDIHHQGYGIKSNYSQPFFIHFDVLLGTRMTREDADRKARPKKIE
ncbi:hypothetical protein TREMEDRAFT_39015 [Tremella mesenterica DSM 1558]|uniref:uncharacterized protein n=1 Tax=Tremella mesenterica (strain ATCC 24925 / CBS 8224 / DSM 1558 / NBRC 9311 / NRRL Y-6157 / RJB 2259-6 / UBC 559-6) TaxID=578456 RepID=UPI0003F49186|nr:uncharacterized protein TREMEDRAFT_39015 [Tremella mesenterica DSM 1558]EIW69412.1 hypothetical protein TREMEDRAFT_39015 [Tremella mesenterica DSM 1558]